MCELWLLWLLWLLWEPVEPNWRCLFLSLHHISWQSWSSGNFGGTTILVCKRNGWDNVCSAVTRFEGSSVSIWSIKSIASLGNCEKTSRMVRRYFFIFIWLKSGKLITEGHTAGHGVPHTRLMRSSCWGSLDPRKMAFLRKSSPRMHPQLHTSIEGPYLNKIYQIN